MMEMPPLPKPENEAQSDDCTYSCPEGWSADQMREYGESCARMAREEAAKACEALADPIDSGWDECIDACAAAIRKG